MTPPRFALIGIFRSPIKAVKRYGLVSIGTPSRFLTSAQNCPASSRVTISPSSVQSAYSSALTVEPKFRSALINDRPFGDPRWFEQHDTTTHSEEGDVVAVLEKTGGGAVIALVDEIVDEPAVDESEWLGMG